MMNGASEASPGPQALVFSGNAKRFRKSGVFEAAFEAKL